jgi:CheY-like chemotaxis protein
MNMAFDPPLRRALVIDADPAMAGLLGEWLESEGFSVYEELPHDSCDLIVADVPQPRLGAPDFLRRLAREHPHTPILALSSNFLPGAGRDLAQALGVAAVLAKPVSREALARTVNTLVDQAA